VTGYDPYIMRQVSCQASRMVVTTGFKIQDWEDLRQELILDVIRRRPKFDASRGDWPGFVRGVVKNRVIVLVSNHKRAEREVLAGDLSDVAGMETVRHTENFVAAIRTEDNAAALRVDVQRVLDALPHQLRSLALLLMELPISEACTKLGKSRSRVYQMVRQLRAVFVRAGFTPNCPKKSGKTHLAKLKRQRVSANSLEANRS
jgi:RNA polymerase sigma-70 factor (ECF subfamily)